ncbi:MAG: putative lactonase precursor [Chthoniobacteraceae bacterium]|nr:putative lactonase precursor [Chthoniobacteraceae bacterium]
MDLSSDYSLPAPALKHIVLRDEARPKPLARYINETEKTEMNDTNSETTIKPRAKSNRPHPHAPAGKGAREGQRGFLACCPGRPLLIAAAFLACQSESVDGQRAGSAASLVYDAQTSGSVPIPPSERGLQTVVAEPWFKVSEDGIVLEGAAFDRDGNLLFADVSGKRVVRVTPEKRLSVVTTQPLGTGGLAIHKDGRVFIAAMGSFKNDGGVLAVAPDGTQVQSIVPPEAGYAVNDLVFDARGGFYFTDARGTSTDPTGGAYYVSPDGKTITPVLPHLAMANGIALSPDGRELWVTEFSRNLLHRVELADAATPAPLGTAVAYQFTGPAPDSMRADAAGNLYVAIYSQGRVLVFNKHGIPIGQVLLPGRDEGHHLLSTSLAIRPGTNELYIVTSDGMNGKGATIFRARGFAQALALYSHQ